MTHTLGLSHSQQATERPTRSRSGRSWRRTSIRECRGQGLAVFITQPREHELAFLSGLFVLMFHILVGGLFTDLKNTSAPQYQSISNHVSSE